MGRVLLWNGHCFAFIGKTIKLSLYKECTAVKKWSQHLHGQHFIIHIACQPLKHLLKLKIYIQAQNDKHRSNWLMNIDRSDRQVPHGTLGVSKTTAKCYAAWSKLLANSTCLSISISISFFTLSLFQGCGGSCCSHWPITWW